MTMKRADMVAVAASATTLTLTMEANESCVIKTINVFNTSQSAEDIKCSVDNRRILNIKVPSSWNFLLADPAANIPNMAIPLTEMGHFPRIPIGSGQTFTLTGAPASSYIEIVYDLYDRDDIKSTDENGSDSPNYRLFQVISNAGTLAAAGDLELNQSDLETVFPAFPGGAVVPAKMEMHLVGLFGAPVTKGTGAANGEYSTRIKFLRDREELFDQDLLGFLFYGNSGHTAATTVYEPTYSRLNVPRANNPASFIIFDSPILFSAGEELNVYATIGRTGAGADFVAGDVKMGLIFDVRKVG